MNLTVALVAALLVWSPYTRELVTPEVLDQQGLTEYGETWWIVKPVVMGITSVAPSAPSNISLE